MREHNGVRMNEPPEDTYDAWSVRDLLDVFRRRRRHFLIAGLVVFAIGIVGAIALPSKYDSSALILIEEQEVPREMITSTITSFAAQQIEVISRRILTSDSAREMAVKLDLFRDPDTGGFPPSSRLATLFRNNMRLDLVSADVIDPRSGRPTAATIAFMLSFQHRNPAKAQLTANELVTRFLDQSLRSRTERAAGTERFLAGEAAALNEELKRLEAEIAQFKQRNDGSMPQRYEHNLDALERDQRDLSDVEARLSELGRRELELSSQLARVSLYAPVVLADGSVTMNGADELEALRAQERRLRTTYTTSHPSLIELSRRIAQLEEELSHTQKEAGAPVADNPAYILLDSHRRAVLAEANALEAQRVHLQARVSELQALVARAPEVERDYNGLLRDYTTAGTKYREIRAKQREAELAENLEQDRKGERFILLEPPSMPLHPSSPNRPALAMISFILAGVVGLAAVAISEMLDPAIHGERQLAKVVGAPPFAVIGFMENAAERLRHRLLYRRAAVAGAAAVVAAVVFVHLAVRPIDVAWFGLLNRFGWS